MQLDNESVEKMAREYNQALAGVNFNNTVSNTDLVERCIILSEDQLDVINSFFYYPQSKNTTKLLNYLKNLISSSIIALNKLLLKGEYVPSFRNIERMQAGQNFCAKLIDIQTDIFVLLDKLSLMRSDISNILIMENRVMSVIAVLSK